MIPASDRDAPWTPLFGGFPVTSWEKTLWQTQESLARLHISSGLGNTLGSPRGSCKALPGKALLEHPTKLMKMDVRISRKRNSCLLASWFTFNDSDPQTLMQTLRLLFPRIPTVLYVLADLFAVSYRKTDIVIWHGIWQQMRNDWILTDFCKSIQ